MISRPAQCQLRVVVICGTAGLISLFSGWVEGKDGEIVKQVVRAEQGGPNLLRPDEWRPWHAGFTREGELLLCDNGSDQQVERGASQTVTLDQVDAEPIVAKVSSRSESVSGSSDSDYSLYLDLIYSDGSHLWGQTAAFDTGTHAWQSRHVVIAPEKPVRQVTVHLLLRRHAGRVWFREPELSVLATPAGAARFDSVAVIPRKSTMGFQVRDVAANSDFVEIEQRALDLTLRCDRSRQQEADFFDVTLTDALGRDRAVTLIFTVPVAAPALQWCHDPRRCQDIAAGQEYLHSSHFREVGTNGRMSRYPLGAVTDGDHGLALGIDQHVPAFFRIGYNAATEELFLAYDLGLTAEKPTARVRFCRFSFDGAHEFRGALAEYYELFPDQFRCRTPRQGLWMPFAKISEVNGWQDFGFQFKEGNNETAWDDEHGIITFRYTEPMTWWMRMPTDEPRTQESALAFARRLADDRQDPRALSLFTSGYEDRAGRQVARLLDTPWCNGAVWSMNSMPGLSGGPTDFSIKWNGEIRQQLYGPSRKATLDGEYIDSSEGYVTDVLDFARDHFAAAQTPLCFCSLTHRPAIFRGLIAFEYVRSIADDVHAIDRLMMANSTPIQLPWLAPLLDVMGTETDWHSGGKWRPMSDADLLYRRALCKGKPFCFLMNTRFEDFSHELVERYMRRALAYGMFPGFFSHNASQGHYFSRPELYNRDRPLFQKYVPICRRLAEAGWEPITGAHSDDDFVYVERFGERLLTVLNDSDQRRHVTIQCDLPGIQRGMNLLNDEQIIYDQGSFMLELAAEDVAVIELE